MSTLYHRVEVTLNSIALPRGLFFTCYRRTIRKNLVRSILLHLPDRLHAKISQILKHTFTYRTGLSRIGLSLLAVAFGCSALISCSKSGDNNNPPPPSQNTQPAIQPKPVPKFDADRVYQDILTQVKFGPRIPNSKAHDSTLAFFQSQIQTTTMAINLQNFVEQGYNGSQIGLTNVLASFNPQATDRILILTHWDSKPWAESEKDPKDKDKPIPAANDGASGSAILLELARIFKDNPPPIGVDLLWDDGEDYGNYSKDQLDKYFLGTKYFMRTKPSTYNPRFAILLDMVGDKEAEFKMEGNSLQAAPQYTHMIWDLAQSMGLSTFRNQPGPDISDDHIPLLQGGMQAVDIIDADLVGNNSPNPRRKYWHTLKDLPENIGTQTLGQVGDLLLKLIYDQLPRTLHQPS